VLLKPLRPYFSSGPTLKPKPWSLEKLSFDFLMGRSHRSKEAKAQMKEIRTLTKQVLQIPQDYQLILVPASATGALLCAFWNFLGTRGVDVWQTGPFSARWTADLKRDLKLPTLRALEPLWKSKDPFQEANPLHDQVIVWNDTASGISLSKKWTKRRTLKGLTVCDATSSVLCEPILWEALDLIAFSYQKGFGAEGGVGALVMSPSAIEHLKAYTPAWPIPRTLALKNEGKLKNLEEDVFPFNTPSLLAFSDILWHVRWASDLGGTKKAWSLVEANGEVVNTALHGIRSLKWVVEDPLWRAASVACLGLTAHRPQKRVENFYNPHNKKMLKTTDEWSLLRHMAYMLETENVAYDCLGHMEAFPCLRFWCGPQIQADDLEKVMLWLIDMCDNDYF